MARTFNGTTDKIQTAVDSSLTSAAYGTIAAVVRVTTQQWNGVYEIVNSTPVDVMALEVSDTGQFTFTCDGVNASFAAGGPAVADGWCLIVGSKATGTVAPLFWKYVYNTGTWSTATGGSTIPDATRAPASGFIGCYEGTTDFFKGDIAAVAYYKNVQLTDAQVRSLAWSFKAWVDLGPTSMSVLDQSATTMKVSDWVGDANESSISGTTIATSSVPVGYGAPILTAVATPGSSSTTATAQVCALTLTPVAITPTPGAVTVTAQVCALTLTAVAGTTSVGAATVTAQPCALTLTAVAGTVTGGATTVTAQVCALTLAPVAITPSIGSSPQTVTAQPCALTLTAVAGTVTGGATTLTAQPCALTLAGIAGVLTTGAVTKTAQVCTLTLTAVPGGVSNGGATITAQPCTLTLTPRPGTITTGAATVVAQPAALTLTAVPIGPYIGGLIPTLITGRLHTRRAGPERTTRRGDLARTSRSVE